MKDLTFDALSLKDKLTLVNDFSDEIMSIEFYDHRIRLYSLNSLLIETYQNIETKEIEQVLTLAPGDLDKYVSQITISSLLAKVNNGWIERREALGY